jgi:hypothetical protein
MKDESQMMRENQHMRTLKELVQDDRYRVDPYVVADAILRRVTMRADMQTPGSAQNECSKPASSASASMKQTPGSPSTTDPIQFNSALG